MSRLTFLTYLDHDVCAGGAWTAEDDALADPPTSMPAHGMIVGETDDLLVLSVSIGGGEAVLPYRVLKSAIRSRVDFETEDILQLMATKAVR